MELDILDNVFEIENTHRFLDQGDVYGGPLAEFFATNSYRIPGPAICAECLQWAHGLSLRTTPQVRTVTPT